MFCFGARGLGWRVCGPVEFMAGTTIRGVKAMTKTTSRAAKVTIFALMSATAMIGCANAQSAPDSNTGEPAATGAERLGDIVVTAQKRETRLQKTAASITAVSGAILQNSAITGVNDLAKAVPGLVVTDGGAGQRRITLRGIRSAGESQVGVYYDEAPVSGPPGTTSDAGGNQSDFNLFDIERVEVLRGPQGTLYGSSSMGGTLRLIYKKPVFDFTAAFDGVGSTTAHGGENYQLNAMANIPIVRDVLAVRAVYYHRNQAGWIDNPKLGLNGINGENTDGGRVLLRFVPASTVTIDAAAYIQDTKGTPTIWFPSLGHYVSGNLAQLPFTDKSRLYTLSGKVDLGFADLVATTAYQDRDSVLIRDPNFLFSAAPSNQTFCRRHFTAATCATPQGLAAYNTYLSTVTPLVYYAPQKVSNWTNEARLTSNSDTFLNWTVGAYWARRHSTVQSTGMLVDARGAIIPSAAPVFVRDIDDTLKQVAGFGEVSVKPVTGMTLTGGLRYYDYSRTVAGDTTKGFDLINFAVQPWTVRKTNEHGWLYRANAAYQASSSVLVYAQVASGFRPGGANQVLGLPSSFTPYQADSLWTYEAGAKTTALNGMFLFNLTGYITVWKNMQVTGTTSTFAFLTNAGSARVKGVEIEAVAAPTPGLQFSTNVSLLSAKLTSDQINGLVTAPGRKGDRIPNIPEVSYTIAGQYEWDVGNGMKALLHADLNYVGQSYADFRPNSVTYRKVGDYALAGFRAGVSTEHWGAFLFVNNVFDVVARTSATNVLGGTLETVTTAPPRTIGINLTAKM
jgi:outer membrane receptor protein involved in Fe transport